MKKNKKVLFIIALIAILFATMQSNASNATESIKQANDLYAKKQYEKALPVYLSLNKEGYVTSALLYNTGCAYFKTNDFVRAILFFERALLLDPNNDDIKFNIDVARTRQVDKLDIIPDFFLTNWMKYAAGISSTNAWSVYGLILFVFALLLLYLYCC